MNIYTDKTLLGPGQVYCKKCLGTGFIQKRFTFRNGGLDESGIRNNICVDCMGTGKFDWIEVIVGKKDRPDDMVETYTYTYNVPEYNNDM